MKAAELLVGRRLDVIGSGVYPEIPGAIPALPSNPDGAIGNVAPTSGAINTKGNWTEVTAGLDYDCYGLQLYRNQAITNHDFLWDVGVGGAGSESVLVANYLETTPGFLYCDHPFLPIFIPRKTRIALRLQTSANPQAVGVWVVPVLINRWTHIPRRCETWGAATGDSGGTSIDPGGSAGTKGSYVQLIASTAFRVRQLVVATGNQRNTARSTYDHFWDIAVGGAGSEVNILSDLRGMSHGTGDYVHPPHYGPFAVDIPAGSRISCRASCSGTDATDRLTDIACYGFGP